MLASLAAFAASSVGIVEGAAFNTISYYLVMVLAVSLCAARAVWLPFERRAWALIALALALDFTADVTFEIFDLPYPSFADLLWLASYPAMAGGLILLLVERVGRMNALVWLDAAIATFTVAALGTAVVLPTIITSLPADAVASATTLAYPVMDLLILALVIVMFAVSGWRAERSWLLIGGAATVWAAGDAIYSYQEAAGTYVSGSAIDITWPVAMAMIAIAAWSRSPASTRTTEGWRAGVLATACGFAAIALIVTGNFRDVSDPALYLATLVLAGLALRLLLTQRENRRLLRLANTDTLTGIGSRGKLTADAANIVRLERPVTVAVFDLDGFKLYNDSFGHPAGDALLQRIARRMEESAGERGAVYRIGGDEFSAVIEGDRASSADVIARIAEAMTESGDGFEIAASIGSAAVPAECPDVPAALALADERMYARKNGSRTSVRSQVHEVLVRSVRERENELADHTNRVRDLAVAVARRFTSDPEQLDEIERSDQLHDVGKVAIPDAILLKPGRLTDEEMALMKQHTLIGERIINASPALAPIARIVRHSHEHWDGGGYPDGLIGPEIPFGSRVILACDAFDAITGYRPYRDRRTVEQAIDELRRCSGTQFDPQVVPVLIEVIRNRMPVPGTLGVRP